MIKFYKGIKEDFAYLPRLEKVVKEGKRYDGIAYGFYWLRFGVSLILLRSRLDNLVETHGGTK